MKKDIRILFLTLATLVSLFFGSSVVNATLFPISSSSPTDGITLDNGQYCDNTCIGNHADWIYQSIISGSSKFADIFFNANKETQEAIALAYARDTHELGVLIPGLQELLQGNLTSAISGDMPGINGYMTINGRNTIIRNGTFSLEVVPSGIRSYPKFIIGIIDKDLNYRFSNNTRGNIRMVPSITKFVIGDSEIDLTPTLQAPITATCTKNGSTWSITTSWAPVPGASSYKVRYLSDGSRDGIVPSNTNTYTFNGITSPNTYSIVYSVTRFAIYSAFSPTKTVICGAETVSIPEISAFTASPTTVTSGQSSTLSWASTNTDKCSISGIGDVSTSGTRVVSPTTTTSYDITCYKGTTASNARSTTVTVAGTSLSGSTSENPYAGSLSGAAKNTINTWITKNIKSRSATLSTENYTKFVESIITKLNQIKATTPASNVNKINLINYIVWELQDIVSNAFLEGLFN